MLNGVGLSAGKSEIGAQNLLFEISVTLTEAGLANYKTVIQRIFEGIASFQSQAYPEVTVLFLVLACFIPILVLFKWINHKYI